MDLDGIARQFVVKMGWALGAAWTELRLAQAARSEGEITFSIRQAAAHAEWASAWIEALQIIGWKGNDAFGVYNQRRKALFDENIAGWASQGQWQIYKDKFSHYHLVGVGCEQPAESLLVFTFEVEERAKVACQLFELLSPRLFPNYGIGLGVGTN